MQTLGFIGFGLIGGSIAKGLKKKDPSIRIMAYARNTSNLEVAQEDGIVNVVLDSPYSERLSECDIIFLCAPVETNIAYMEKIAPLMKEGAVLTDVGSAKIAVCEKAKELHLEDRFIGGHPMAGSEQTGYKAATDYLFSNAYYIITPISDAHPELARRLIVNIAAGNGRDGKNFGLVSYTGTADRGGAAGVYLAPAGTIRFAGALTGAVYAKNAAVDGKLSYATEADQAGKSKEDTEEAATEKASAALMEETAAEVSQNAADKDSTDDSRKVFSGTLKVNAFSQNAEDPQKQEPLKGVVFSLYERANGQTDGQRDQLVYSWTSGEEAKQIPAGLLSYMDAHRVETIAGLVGKALPGGKR